MKNFKLVLNDLLKIFLLSAHLVIVFMSYLYGKIKHNLGTTILILLAFMTVVIAWLTYRHIVKESEETKKTGVTLQGRTDFYNIYFDDFDHAVVFKPKISFDQPWPEKASEFGEFSFFGLNPQVWLKILNESRHAITVSYIMGYMSFGSYTDKELIWHSYFEQGFREISKFPLFLEPQQEKIVIFSFPWPISGTLRDRLPKLTPDSLYTAPYLVNGYLRIMGRGMFGDPEGYEYELKNILIQDLTEQIGLDSIANGNIQLKAILSTGEYFTTNIPLP